MYVCTSEEALIRADCLLGDEAFSAQMIAGNLSNSANECIHAQTCGRTPAFIYGAYTQIGYRYREDVLALLRRLLLIISSECIASGRFGESRVSSSVS